MLALERYQYARGPDESEWELVFRTEARPEAGRGHVHARLPRLTSGSEHGPNTVSTHRRGEP